MSTNSFLCHAASMRRFGSLGQGWMNISGLCKKFGQRLPHPSRFSTSGYHELEARGCRFQNGEMSELGSRIGPAGYSHAPLLAQLAPVLSRRRMEYGALTFDGFSSVSSWRNQSNPSGCEMGSEAGRERRHRSPPLPLLARFDHLSDAELRVRQIA